MKLLARLTRWRLKHSKKLPKNSIKLYRRIKKAGLS